MHSKQGVDEKTAIIREMTKPRPFVASKSPVFVATFGSGDGVVVTRMTTFIPGKLDLARGARLARAAYESRKKQPAPAITTAHFERDGEVLETYTREELETVL
jgi:hypothetical protein